MIQTSISINVKKLLDGLPDTIKLVAACKTRTPDEIQTAVDAGIKIVGHNYVQEAEESFDKIDGKIKWHMIGHLQKNKVKRAVKIFDMIQSLDSYELAKLINVQCGKIDKVMDCLIEVNSGKEDNKTGILPEKVEELAVKVFKLQNIRISGLMTMGPFLGAPDDFRPYFKVTKKLFDSLKVHPVISPYMKYLSMGMSVSYQEAIKQSANMIRIGTDIFGPREN